MNDFLEGHDFVKVEKTVEEVLTENNLQSVLYFSKIQKHWEIIVGEPLAAKTSPVQLIKKKLIVHVVDAAYSHHLKFFEKNIIDLIASPEICGEGVVNKVIFKVGKPLKKALDQKSATASDDPKQLHPALDEVAVETAESIEDKKLKASFTRLMSSRINKKIKSENES